MKKIGVSVILILSIIFLNLILIQAQSSPEDIFGFDPDEIPTDPEELKERISDGYKFIAYSLDIRMLDQTCRLGLEGIK